MGPAIQKLIAKAVVTYLNGDFELFRSWTHKAMEALNEEKERNRLHATVAEILEYKKKNKIKEDKLCASHLG